MRILSLISAIVLSILLTGCGPVYETKYSYHSPATEQGKMCAVQCQQNKNMCESNAQEQMMFCKSQSRKNAVIEFENYKHEQEKNHLSVLKTIDDFDTGSYRCELNTAKCLEDFHICYNTCGGQVTAQTVCTANCDKA